VSFADDCDILLWRFNLLYYTIGNDIKFINIDLRKIKKLEGILS